MCASLDSDVIQLVGSRPLAIRGARGCYLECKIGAVWLTVEGQAGDFVIAQGKRVRIESNGLALVEGVPFGAIRLVGASLCADRHVDRCLRPSFPRPKLARFRLRIVS